MQLSALAAIAALLAPAAAQTYSTCNPLTSSSCPADSALGRHVDISFTSASDSFSSVGNAQYGSNGVSLTVAKAGDAPTITSKWYIMFGQVDAYIKAAPGAGIVSSFVMQSDDLDEIDWEWLGADNTQVQSNYFGKGQTTTYNRGAFHADAGNQGTFKKYTVIWTSTQIVWQIDGATVRVLNAADAQGQFPQTPMQIKLGAWSGGDPSNAPGTIEWARGPTVFANGPFTMQVKSISVSDYSTGTQYKYGDSSGTWQSIVAVGGKVNSGGASQVQSNAPAITSSTSGQPMPFDGTHKDSSSVVATPSVYPWVPGSSTLATSAVSTATTYPGLPSGWTVSSDGKVIPPSSAPSISPLASSTSSLPASQSASLSVSAPEVTTAAIYNGAQASFTTLTSVSLISSGPLAPLALSSQAFNATATSASNTTVTSTTASASQQTTNAANQRTVFGTGAIVAGLIGAAMML